MKSMSAIRATKAQRENSLLDIEGVTGVDIGSKITRGKVTEEVAIRIYVSKKKPLKDLNEASRIPKEIDGVKTDVIERRYVLHQAQVALQDLRRRADAASYNPLQGGISIGPCTDKNGFVYVGTLGCMVKDRSTGEKLMLSNYHVLAEKWNNGESVCQPSRVDGGSCPTDVVGSLVRSVLNDEVDGAVASMNGRPFVCEIAEIGHVKGQGVATVDAKVRKRGRTTGLTHGIVESTDLTVQVEYDSGLKILKNQISIAADTSQGSVFGLGGDSGSVVVDDQGNVIGLYFAGDESGAFGVANPIQSALDALNVDLCTTVLIEPTLPKRDLASEAPVFKLFKEFKEWKEWKEHAYEKATFNEEFNWDWLERILPPEWINPRSGSVDSLEEEFEDTESSAALEERVAQLEAMLATSESGASLMSGSAAVAADKFLLSCTNFFNKPVGLIPNPYQGPMGKFWVYGFTGELLPKGQIQQFGASNRGLNASRRVVVRHGAVACVRIKLVRFTNTPSTIRAFNRAGQVVASATFAAPQGQAKTVTLKAKGIVRVEISSPQNEVLILSYCRCTLRPPKLPKPEKFEKFELKEKPEKIEIKELKDKPEPKELKDKPEPKELKDKPEPKELKDKPEPKELKEKSEPKELLEGPPGGNLGNPPVPDPIGGGLLERLARIEALLLPGHFIDPSLRPDIRSGALRNEDDADDYYEE